MLTITLENRTHCKSSAFRTVSEGPSSIASFTVSYSTLRTVVNFPANELGSALGFPDKKTEESCITV